MRRILFIVNARARERDPAETCLIEQHLADHSFGDAEAEIFVSRNLEEARALVGERIRSRAVDVVVAVGGDGSVMGLLPLLIAHPEVKLGIVPLGTGNLLAYNLGIPDMETAFAVLREGVPIAMDVGCINGDYFGLMCMIGTEAKAFGALHPVVKKHWGILAYFVNHVRGLFLHEQLRFRLRTPELAIETKAHTLVVSNAAGYSRLSTPYISGSSVRDGLLDVCLIRAQTPAGRLLAAWRIMTGGGRRVQDERLIRFQTPWMDLQIFPSPVVSVDGTPVPSDGRLEISVLPSAVQVLVPPETVSPETAEPLPASALGR